MIPDIVVDIGNSRIKWGRCQGPAVIAMAGLPHEDPAAWHDQLLRWSLTGPLVWLVSGVHPRTRDRLTSWIRQRGDEATLLESAERLTLRTRLAEPDQAGIDRLLNAVAVNSRRQAGTPAVIVDAGSAVTVDYLDTEGVFCGGAIFPGLGLMARALHEQTALLPLVDVRSPLPGAPAVATRPAMEAGIYWSVAGGIRSLVDLYGSRAGLLPQVFLGGGDGRLLEPALGGRGVLWLEMTLEGLRLAGEKLP
jgi:type III pantothenate kinase